MTGVIAYFAPLLDVNVTKVFDENYKIREEDEYANATNRMERQSSIAQ